MVIVPSKEDGGLCCFVEAMGGLITLIMIYWRQYIHRLELCIRMYAMVCIVEHSISSPFVYFRPSWITGYFALLLPFSIP